MRESFVSAFGRSDVVLVIAAVTGLLFYLLGLPRIHLDRSVRGHVPQHTAVDSARAFLLWTVGEDVDAMRMRARIRRDPVLLDSLQQTHGRGRTVEFIRQAEIPAYYWEVQVTDRAVEGDGEDRGSSDVTITAGGEMDNVTSVRLTTDGRPFFLRLAESAAMANQLHRESLNALFADTLQGGLLETVDVERWSFRFDDYPQTGVQDEMRTGAGRDEDRMIDGVRKIQPTYLPSEGRVVLDRADAAAIARYHLRRTMLGAGVAGGTGGEIRIDSVTAAGRSSNASATVHVSWSDPVAAQSFSAAAEVAPTGALLNLEPAYVRQPNVPSLDLNSVLDIAEFIAYVLLALVAFGIFLRRIRHQLIDAGAALRDGALAAIAAALTLAGDIPTELTEGFSLKAVMIILSLVLMSILAGALVFFISGAAGSAAHDAWGDKLRTLDLARHAYLLNRPVGRSIIRGTLTGFVLVGLLCAGMVALPDASLNLSADPLFYRTGIPGVHFLSSLGGSIYKAVLVTFLAIAMTAAIVRNATSSPAAVVVVITLVLAAAQITPLNFHPIPYIFIISAALGLIIGLIFISFDLLSVFVGLLTFSLLWSAAPGWVVPGTPEWLDGLLALIFVGGLATVGVFGVAGGRTSEDIPVIMPEYVEELARKQRIERELELARSMQMSFLPRETPDVRGLDIASVCVPAYEVGGDYFDFFRLDERRLAFAVGDVSGKGMQAAFYMTLMKGILQSLVLDGAGPARILSRANEIFRMNAGRTTFMSMALGVLDLEESTLVFARAGHNPLLVQRADSEAIESIKPTGAALGLMNGGTFEHTIEEVVVHLKPGDLLVVYTDGVTEAMNARHELYGEERLEAVVRETSAPASATLQRVVDDVVSFCNGAPGHDDMTLLVARLTPDRSH